MLGLIVSILMAAFRFFSDVLSKTKVDEDNIHSLTLSVFYRITGVPVLIFAVWFFGLPDEIDRNLFIAILISGPSMVIATILYMKALKISDISLVAPIKSLSPLFTILTSFVILGELPSYKGLIGVILVLIGIYILKIENLDKEFLQPIKSLVGDRGVQLVFIIAIIYSITAPIDKLGVQASSPAFYSLSLYSSGSIGLVLFHWYSIGGILKQTKKTNLKHISLIGFFNGFSSLLQMIAFSLTLVVYVVSIKRLSTFASALYGTLFLDEGITKARIIGSLIMISGIILISLELST